MLIRAILPDQFITSTTKKVVEGDFDVNKIQELNEKLYNIYTFPNYPSKYSGGHIDGIQVDVFEWVFVDCDLKDKVYLDKQEFFNVIAKFDLPPTKVVDSGNGVHAYWKISDLDAISFLRLQRRLMRHFRTDEAVAKICQLMRVEGTVNTKDPQNLKLCELIYEDSFVYTCEQLSTFLSPITKEDEDYCQTHYAMTYNLQQEIEVDDKIPLNFAELLRTSPEAKQIWLGNTDDRSESDYRLGHLMFASEFTKDEAMSVLVNAQKALQRAPKHRVSYAKGIVDKIWTYELDPAQKTALSRSVMEILSKGEEAVKGTRFPCHPLLDSTECGFRLGHVIGLVAGAGVGKTSMALNMFKWFTERNPEYDHFFISLEQPENEIATRWQTLCQGDTRLHSKVHVLSNYDLDGTFRHLSLDDIKSYILEFQKTTGKKIGTCVIDHIGVLKKQNKNGENQALVDICHQMKGFAVETNTMVIMQSQAPREKAGIGDLELNKDAAYGTVFFESYVDWFLCMWQPLKRVYSEGAPTVIGFKYAKIRHKRQGVDKIQEDVCYQVFFDPKTERIRELTQEEEVSAKYFVTKATNARKQDRKTDEVIYTTIRTDEK